MSLSGKSGGLDGTLRENGLGASTAGGTGPASGGPPLMMMKGMGDTAQAELVGNGQGGSSAIKKVRRRGGGGGEGGREEVRRKELTGSSLWGSSHSHGGCTPLCACWCDPSHSHGAPLHVCVIQGMEAAMGRIMRKASTQQQQQAPTVPASAADVERERRREKERRAWDYVSGPGHPYWCVGVGVGGGEGGAMIDHVKSTRRERERGREVYRGSM